MTPEGKIKARVNKIIAKYGDLVYKYMPVPAGYGPSSLDYILCCRGQMIAVETKAPGKSLTPRQLVCARQIKNAGGIVFVIDGEDYQYDMLEGLLEWLCKSEFPANTGLSRYLTPPQFGTSL